MSEHNQNDPKSQKSGASPARKLSCEEWEAILVDFLDGALQPSDANSFHNHRESCAACAEMFSQASQGREWLNFLRAEPPVPSVLVSKILAQTSGRPSTLENSGDIAGELMPAPATAIPIAAVLPFWKRGGLGYAGRQVAQPRLLMTAAMAFFSITLTLNMAGVRLTAVRFSDLKPSALSTNLNKQYHLASSRVVRYYDNLRFVYEMEAQVKEMRRNADLEQSSPAQAPDQVSPSATPPNGDHKNGGKSQVPNIPAPPRAMFWGEKVEAALRNPSGDLRAYPMYPIAGPEQSGSRDENTTDSRAADQAERGIA